MREDWRLVVLVLSDCSVSTLVAQSAQLGLDTRQPLIGINRFHGPSPRRRVASPARPLNDLILIELIREISDCPTPEHGPSRLLRYCGAELFGGRGLDWDGIWTWGVSTADL